MQFSAPEAVAQLAVIIIFAMTDTAAYIRPRIKQEPPQDLPSQTRSLHTWVDSVVTDMPAA